MTCALRGEGGAMLGVVVEAMLGVVVGVVVGAVAGAMVSIEE